VFTSDENLGPHLVGLHKKVRVRGSARARANLARAKMTRANLARANLAR
jgi:uncharacterized protein YjbI with pentapeptide repeats